MTRYYSRLSEDDCIEAIRLAYSLSKQHMEHTDENFKGTPEFFYGMICLAGWKMQWVREALSKKNNSLTEKQAEEISERRCASLLSVRKDRVKRGRLTILIDTRLYPVVQKLRLQGVSWREISNYLKKYHKTNISHVHLHKLFKKITTEKKLRGENEI